MSSKDVELIILGSSSGTPTVNRRTSAQLFKSGHHTCLIDCGEGTQVTMRALGLKMMSIDHIFISHLHGDHYFGLAPLLSSFHLSGRERPLHIYADSRLESLISLQFGLADTKLRYPVEYHSLDDKNARQILQTGNFKVTSFPLDHRIPTCGFRFDTSLHSGKELSYVYASDTRFDDRLIKFAEGATLFYHEATFLDDMKDEAFSKYHATAAGAAQLAVAAKAHWLLIGHFSTRYHDTSKLLAEATQVFPNTMAAEDGLWIRFMNDGSLNLRKGFEIASEKV